MSFEYLSGYLQTRVFCKQTFKRTILVFFLIKHVYKPDFRLDLGSIYRGSRVPNYKQ